MLTTNASLMDGINRHILTIAPVLNSMSDCQVAVCTVFPKSDLAVALEAKGVRTFSLNCSNGHDFKIFTRFNKVMNMYNPNIVHSHVMAIFERIVLATCFRKVKYINTIHGISDEIEHKTFRIRLESVLTRLFPISYSAECYVSNGVRQHFLPNIKALKGVYTIYNPIKFSETFGKQYNLHEEIGVSKETRIIGTACRFAKVKNPVAFTKTMCMVLKSKEDVHAAVMGDGDKKLKTDLCKIVDGDGVSNRFHWLGYRQDAPSLVRDFDCFVMTSISEGMPTSVLEAMSNKTPFAMMDGDGGLKDIAEINKNEGPIGIVVSKGDVKSMANEICALLDNKPQKEQMADRAYIIGKKYFDVDSVCEKICKVYKEICER